MADSSSTSSVASYGGASIIYLSQDQLFSILLLLPVDSILSFALTCKRFKSLACSDSLWEPVCRRDWGQACVDAMKSSFKPGNGWRSEISWLQVYKQVKQLDSVCCRRLDNFGSEPSPRASHSLNFVSDCLVLFGGGCEGGRHLDDTWVAYVGNNFQYNLQWQKIDSRIPTGRFGHTCVVLNDYLVLFGGINDNGLRQNDTWIGKIECNEMPSITLTWKLLNVGPCMPPPRGAHAACGIGNSMIVHGGIGLSGVRLGDTWVLDLSTSNCCGRWREILTHSGPPARSGHSLTSFGGTQAVLFGGRGLGYEVLSDVWLFDLNENYLNWVQVFYERKDAPPGVSSLSRVGHSATLILGGRVLIHGGEDSFRHRKGDFWLLDIKPNPSVKTSPIELNSKLLNSKRGTWKMLKANGYSPNSRSFHRACTDPSGRHMYVFGGMVDGPLQPGEDSALRFDKEIFVVELML
ncbi:hypothetical protein QQ045_008455 [Rhodiola kirilowii]